MSKKKKRFDCGHLGFGKFCHLCQDKTGNTFYRTKDKKESVIIEERIQNGKKIITGMIVKK